MSKQQAQIVNHATQGERNAWNRKRRQIEALVEQIQPVEQQIIEMRGRIQPTYDTIAEIRESMIHDCIHPADMLIDHDGVTICKFCERRFVVPNNTQSVDTDQ